MRTPTAPFALRRARTLDAALKILREEPGTVPIAGCTDVYVALEFGGTPGVILAAHALVESTRRPTLERVREALAGNLCRCTGYEAIHRAVLSAHAERHAGATSSAPAVAHEKEA